MLNNALKMSKWFSSLLVLTLITISTCEIHLIVLRVRDDGEGEPVSGTVEATEGSNLTLLCRTDGSYLFLQEDVVWGRRTKQLRFKNEHDLEILAKQGSQLLADLQRENEPYHWSSSAKTFAPLKLSDRGTHFCMNLQYGLFKVVHIKVNEIGDLDPVDQICRKNKFKCVSSGICINAHYKCDGRPDCFDGSDEKFCGGDPCAGKIQCGDGRCIPTTWCCDKRTDEDCDVEIAARPRCCPALFDPYDPLHKHNQTDVKPYPRNGGSKYLFITICVISAVLSFVLFLFIISKVCGFDAKPSRPRIAHNESFRNQNHISFNNFARCEHSECAIRREFSPNSSCLYRTGASDIHNINSDNNNEVVDPLIGLTAIGLITRATAEHSDQPPPYAEVVGLPPSLDKSSLEDLINAPPPPYSSTKYLGETEGGNGNGDIERASDCANEVVSNICINQSARCDIGTTGDRNSSE